MGKRKGASFLVREFRSFIRMETCLFISCIGLSGYLLFNPLSLVMIPLFAAIFFLTGASYGYNHIKDREEDRINNKRLNFFVTHRLGMRAVFFLLSLGFFFSLLLPPPSFLAFMLSIALAVAYSRFRIKEIFLAKNLYTGLTIGLMFIIGALAGGSLPEGMGPPFLIAFFFGLMLNMLGDIRGYEGDLSAGVKTLPIAMGTGPSKRLAHFMFLGFSSSIFIFGLHPFYPLALFPYLISLSLALERHKTARSLIISSFIIFSGFLLFLKIQGGL